ncbi:MAG TPA: PIG-L family deacetylase [Patescibacteria group bacterium]|nr:PIG-L family deacetylase [Patescibacteria group bacterium]
MGREVAIAIGAHPDDIEFYMAGTLLVLKAVGYEIHYFNIASGNCGSSQSRSAATRATREREARAASKVLGASFHRSLTDDLEIFYDLKLLRQITAVVREVRPGIVLTHSPQDYMEDHTNTCRLAVTATFARGMPNFSALPPTAAADNDVVIYHCMPHGLTDSLRKRVVPGIFVNTTRVQQTKVEALARHQSQQKWLDISQGFDSYLQAMDRMSRELGRMSKRFKHAEGWRRHLHLGFSAAEIDPLREAIGRNYLVNAAYERALDS